MTVYSLSQNEHISAFYDNNQKPRKSSCSDSSNSKSVLFKNALKIHIKNNQLKQILFQLLWNNGLRVGSIKPITGIMWLLFRITVQLYSKDWMAFSHAASSLVLRCKRGACLHPGGPWRVAGASVPGCVLGGWTSAHQWETEMWLGDFCICSIPETRQAVCHWEVHSGWRISYSFSHCHGPEDLEAYHVPRLY